MPNAAGYLPVFHLGIPHAGLKIATGFQEFGFVLRFTFQIPKQPGCHGRQAFPGCHDVVDTLHDCEKNRYVIGILEVSAAVA